MFLNPVGFLGGAERVLLDVMRSVQSVFPEADLSLLIGSDGALARRATELNIQVEVLPIPEPLQSQGDSTVNQKGLLIRLAALSVQGYTLRRHVNRYAAQLRERVASLQPSLVHSNGIKTHILGHFAELHEYPLIWHVHDYLSNRPLASKVLRWVCRKPRNVIAVSESVAADATRVLATPVTSVHNGVDLTEFTSEGSGVDLDRMAGMPPAPAGTIRVGLVATYAYWKGQDTFLEAISHIPEHAPSARFYVVGGPVYQTTESQFRREELEHLAAKAEVTERVGFVDFQDPIAPVYHALDVVVHASTKPEPFGRTIAEAMACGKPVIMSRDSGMMELAQDGLDVIGFTPGDPRELATAITSLLESRDRREALAGAARMTAETSLSMQRFAKGIASVYHEALCVANPGPLMTP